MVVLKLGYGAAASRPKIWTALSCPPIVKNRSLKRVPGGRHVGFRAPVTPLHAPVGAKADISAMVVDRELGKTLMGRITPLTRQRALQAAKVTNRSLQQQALVKPMGARQMSAL